MSAKAGGITDFSRSSRNRNYQETRAPLPETEGDTATRLANEQVAQQQAAGYGDLIRDTPGTLGAGDQGLLDQATANVAQMTQGGGMTLSPEQLAFLNEIFANEQTAGIDTLTRLGKEIAAQRGFALSDSPIANPLMAEGQRLALNLGTQRARTGLEYGQQAFANNQAIQAFQNQLKQQALANRAGLLQGQPGSFGYQQGQNAFRGSLGTTTGQERIVDKTFNQKLYGEGSFGFGGFGGGGG